jgi:hypothetical protein
LFGLSSVTNAPATATPLSSSTSNRLGHRIYSACDRYRRQLLCGIRKANDDPSVNINLSLDHHEHSSLFPSIDYATPVIARTIKAELVSLPAVAGTAELSAILPPHLSSLYASPSQLHRPAADVKPARRAFLCSANEYHLLLRRMNERGMLSFTQQPVCVNGLFGVPKDGDAIRLIIDCRPVNALLVPSPKVALPTPDLIAQFNIAADAPLFAAKVDLDNAYHRIRMPAAWHPYFALPPIRASDIGGIIGYGNDAIVYPCCSTLPMGFSHAVYLAQAAHEYIVDTRVPLLRANDRISHVADRTLDRMRHSIYIDDLNLY